MTTKEKLLHRRSLAELVQGICGFLLLGPPVLLVLLVLLLPASPEAGFTGMRLIWLGHVVARAPDSARGVFHCAESGC
jgi:hypothetical protein